MNLTFLPNQQPTQIDETHLYRKPKQYKIIPLREFRSGLTVSWFFSTVLRILQ